MKRKKFSVEQIVSILKQANLGLPVADLIRQVGISEQTFYRWKRQYAGLESDQVREFAHETGCCLPNSIARLQPAAGLQVDPTGSFDPAAHQPP